MKEDTFHERQIGAGPQCKRALRPGYIWGKVTFFVSDVPKQAQHARDFSFAVFVHTFALNPHHHG